MTDSQTPPSQGWEQIARYHRRANNDMEQAPDGGWCLWERANAVVTTLLAQHAADDRQIADLKERLRLMKQQVDEMAKLHTEAEAELDAEREKSHDYYRSAVGLREQVTVLIAQVKEQRKQKIEMTGLATKLEAEVARLTQENEELTLQKVDWDQFDSIRTEKENVTLRSELQQLRQEHAHLKAEKTEAHDIIANLIQTRNALQDALSRQASMPSTVENQATFRQPLTEQEESK